MQLGEDPAYRVEYERFVVSMSYARADETPSFETALESLGRFCAQLTTR